MYPSQFADLDAFTLMIGRSVNHTHALLGFLYSLESSLSYCKLGNPATEPILLVW